MSLLPRVVRPALLPLERGNTWSTASLFICRFWDQLFLNSRRRITPKTSSYWSPCRNPSFFYCRLPSWSHWGLALGAASRVWWWTLESCDLLHVLLMTHPGSCLSLLSWLLLFDYFNLLHLGLSWVIEIVCQNTLHSNSQFTPMPFVHVGCQRHDHKESKPNVYINFMFSFFQWFVFTNCEITRCAKQNSGNNAAQYNLYTYMQ